MLVFDELHDHYLLIGRGWPGEERIKKNTIHVRLRDGKIRIEEDWTEDGVVTDFLQPALPLCDRAPPTSSRSNEQRATTTLAVSAFENLLLK